MIEFIRPLWLFLLPVVMLVVLLRRYHGGASPWRAIVDSELLPHLLVGRHAQEKNWPWLTLASAWVVGVVALAGPAIQGEENRVMDRIQARVIVLDLSPSMNSPDVSPTRLERARFKIRDVLEQGSDAQHGLVVFSGDAFVVSPVTDDSRTLLNLLDTLSTDIMPISGNRLDRALNLALELISRTHASGGEIFLVTDGVGEESPDAEAVAGAGSVLNVLMVGTTRGAPIPAPEGGFIKDDKGNILIQGVDFKALTSLAEQGHGVAVRMSLDGSDLAQLGADAVSSTGVSVIDRPDEVIRWKDIGPWLVLLLLPLGLIAFRRGWLLCLILICPPKDATAFGWQDLWQRPDQQAAHDIAAGDFESAASRGSSAWTAPARYRAGDYSGAVDAYSKPEGADGFYNLGNALAKAGQLDKALEAYAKALALSPDHEDAKFNRDLVKQLLQQQQQNPSENSSPGQGDPSGESSQDKNNQNAESESSDNSGQNEQGSDSPEQTSTDDKVQPEQSSGNGEDAKSASADQHNEKDHESSQTADETTAREPDSEEPTEGTVADNVDGQRSEEEIQQSLERWLRQVPDDPEGLLRRKFLYQYRQRLEK